MKTNAYAEGRAPGGPLPKTPGKPAAKKTKAPARTAWAEWRLPAALILLVAIPLAAGVFILTEPASGAAITPDNARFFASPVPVVVHILNAGLPSWARSNS